MACQHSSLSHVRCQCMAMCIPQYTKFWLVQSAVSRKWGSLIHWCLPHITKMFPVLVGTPVNLFDANNTYTEQERDGDGNVWDME